MAECEGCLLSGQAFSAGAAMRWLSGQVAASQRGAFSGLRVAMDMNWALRPVNGVEELPASWPVEHGHGLWLVRKVADQASLDTGPSGTVAVIDFRFESLRATS